jgi:hypothetical protein
MYLGTQVGGILPWALTMAQAFDTYYNPWLTSTGSSINRQQEVELAGVTAPEQASGVGTLSSYSGSCYSSQV